MREVIISRAVRERIADIEQYLQFELHLSRYAARKRSDKMREFVLALRGSADYALCRFAPWRALGYHCVSFEGWVFAYEIVPEGVIVRDMSHGKLLVDVM